VGANIGDTVAMIESEISDYSKILCVEGSESFYNLLQKNFGLDPSVKIEHVFLSEPDDGSNNLRISLISQNGTAALVATDYPEDGSVTVPFFTLDDIVEKHRNVFLKVDLIKVDTDGFDY
jgi:FkbM family methyltransferase